MTLEKSLLSKGILAKEIQLGWWLDPMRGSPSQFDVLGILWILDHSSSWIKMILKCTNNSRRVLTMSEFLQTFCKKILRFLIIIDEKCRSHQNKLILICFHRSQHTSSDAILYWTGVSKTDTDWSLLGSLHDNSST